MHAKSGLTETLLVEGHIIDSLTLTKILDRILDEGGRFSIEEFQVGQHRDERSRALLKVSADSLPKLDRLIKDLRNLGAEVLDREDVRLAPAPQAGVFPDDFYCTTHLETWIRWKGRWQRVRRTEMDCGIRMNPSRGEAEAVRFRGVRRGDLLVVGHQGVKVLPLERPRGPMAFEFMTSEASTEKPKAAFVHQVAREIRDIRRQKKGKVLVVAGPAVIHTGAREDLAWLIQNGYVHVLFGGNAVAAHDIEASLFGTSLGLSLKSGRITREGHEHHLRAINRIRRAGSIRRAVQKGLVKTGIMAACVRKNIPFVLAGSIRDDGPLPDTMTDVMVAQDEMRKHLKGVELALLLATTLHAVATGNLLPARVKTVFVDINPSAVTKLSDRGTLQSIGLVTDVGYFLRELRTCLQRR